MSRLNRVVLASALCTLVIMFQNCAPGKSSRSERVSSSSTINNGSYTPCRNEFCVSYYNDVDRADFAMEAMDQFPIDHDWGGESPDPSIDADTFSAYWLGNFDFEAGTYEFSVTADDGVQLLIDGNVLIDQYFDQGPTTYTQSISLSRGLHTVEIYYYENGGGAVLKASFSRL